MSRFLILSACGVGVGLGLRLKLEGHEPLVKIFNKDYDSQGRGLVERADKYQQGQVVIADETDFGSILDSYREAGVPIFAGGSFADRLENDRQFAEEVMHEASIDTPDSVTVKSWDDAAKQAERMSEKSGKVALKPGGERSGVVPSYVASDVEDALTAIERFKKELPEDGLELTVQEFIEGIAISTEGWFTGEDWVPGMFNRTIERKQFLDGDLGPSTGCTGNIVWRIDPKDPILTETLTKLTEVLRKHRYVGPLDINCVVNKEGIYGLEFTPRFGFDAFPTALHSLCDFDFGVFIDACARGYSSSFDFALLSDGFGAGIRLSLPPWPFDKLKSEGGVALQGFDEDAREYFYPQGIIEVDGELRSAPGDNILGVMNYEGLSIGQAFACVYHQIRKLKIPDLQYRTDLTKQCLKDYRELQKILHGDGDGWIGVDFDGTLAEYHGWSNDLGDPVPKMVQKVKRWIAEGKEVRIMTARGSVEGEGEADKYVQLMKMYDWVEDHIGAPLEITHEKDPEMIRLYDDRVVKVEANEGVLI